MVWSPQHYLSTGRAKGRSECTLQNAVDQVETVLNGYGSPPSILTLNHLAERVGIPYTDLRFFVNRKAPFEVYRHFYIRKRSGGRRIISVPHPKLKRLQRWINAHILSKQKVHRCSFAFQPRSSIVYCAARHTGARWIVKIDVTNFFGSISEIQVYRVFLSLGYQPLVAFELARLTTCITRNTTRYYLPQWRAHQEYQTIADYNNPKIGHLPQGAPTSPMLSNLVSLDLDTELELLSSIMGLNYTRYCDDITFSTRKNITRSAARKVIDEASSILSRRGFYLNKHKTAILPPGSRKIVLGLNVEGDSPRLSRQFRDNLRHHLYFLKRFGPIEHMEKRGFETVLGMKNHIRGLIDYARMVENKTSTKLLEQFEDLDWPI